MNGRADPFADDGDLKADDFKPQAPAAPRPTQEAVADMTEPGFERKVRPSAKPVKKQTPPSPARRRRRRPVSDEPKEQLNQKLYTKDVDAYLEISDGFDTQADAFRAVLAAYQAQQAGSAE